MKKIIHLSDLHIGHKDCAEKFETIILNIARRMQPVEEYVIVITGDLADNVNKPDQREKAASAIENLKTLGYHVLVVPGNHDYGTGTVGNVKNVRIFKEIFYGDPGITYPKLDIIEETAFIGLDSTAEELNWYDRVLAQGELGREQLERLRKILEDSSVRNLKKVVYLHHHPFDFKLGRQLKDSDDLRDIIENKIDVLLFGHYHRSKTSAGKILHGTWGIPRCYNAGTATHKNGNPGFHRVIDLSQNDPVTDYDGCFI
ncbi:MAG: metallophosphoesterase [Bacteroidales bacterium]|nr:metallophosphoesterase [Bacteroidales bacterium]